MKPWRTDSATVVLDQRFTGIRVLQRPARGVGNNHPGEHHGFDALELLIQGAIHRDITAAMIDLYPSPVFLLQLQRRRREQEMRVPIMQATCLRRLRNQPYRARGPVVSEVASAWQFSFLIAFPRL